MTPDLVLGCPDCAGHADMYLLRDGPLADTEHDATCPAAVPGAGRRAFEDWIIAELRRRRFPVADYGDDLYALHTVAAA